DDLATSHGLMLALSMIKEFILEYFREGIKMAKKADKKLVFHSDGDVTEVLDTLVEMGFDAVNPLQPELNDLERFKERYQGKLAVYGGLENSKIIPDGSVKDVREHVENIFQTPGKEGGLVLSSHDIPIHCPQKNIEVMVKAIKECTY
ncbi:MAG: uroporphyrinogen decarboxylase family protein, partial [bacterium]